MVTSDGMILLIEPVWNRNSEYKTQTDSPSILLIEPVWNRNNLRAKIAETPELDF